MSKDAAPSDTSVSHVLKNWGFWAVILGATSLILVLVQIFGPSLEPKASAGVQIGEIAAEIKRSAWRSLFGLSNPVPEPQAAGLSDWLPLAAPALGVVAIVLAVISGVLRENWRYPVYATGLGAAAVLIHFFWWMAMIIVGMLLLIAIIENLGDIFSF